MATQSVTLKQLSFGPETLGHLIADRWLSVPPYQRGYSWGTDEVEEFWSDLEGALNDGREYFIGAVVVAKAGVTYQVIDGQQRLATTSLLFAAMRDELAAIGDKPLEKHVDERYLRSFDRRSSSMAMRLRVAPGDADFYEKRFILRSGGEPRTPSQQRLLDAFTLLRARVAGLAEGKPQAARSAAINRWIDHLEQSVVIILVEAATDVDAYQIFETLNDRGATLTIADLLKNYLLSFSPSNAAALGQLWDESIGSLGADMETQEFVTFIRHLWNSRHGATRERDLYGSIRQGVDNPKKAQTFLREMVTAAGAYAAILEPSHVRWERIPDQARRAIETLLYFQLGQYRPLLLAGLETFPPDEVALLAESLVSWSFRGLIFGGIGGGTAERVYSSAAVSVRDGARTVGQVFVKLRPIIPNDEDFRAAFERTTLKRTRLAHYVMRALERGLSNDARPALEPYPPEKDPSISGHILPRSAESSWPGFAADEVAGHVHMIGNLILRPAGREAAPVDEASRLKWAAGLGPVVNRDVARYDSWSPNALRQRQQDLAALALRVWPRELKGQP